MARIVLAPKINFSAGEISPEMQARIDTPQYAAGLKTLENAFVLPTGVAANRPGTEYIGAANSDIEPYSRLVPFVFSDGDAYVLEFSEHCIRFYKDGVLIETAPDTPYEVVIPYGWEELIALRFTQSADSLVIVHKGYQPRVLVRYTDTSWILSNYDYEFRCGFNHHAQRGYREYRVNGCKQYFFKHHRRGSRFKPDAVAVK
jgi:hypothetical protein